MHRVTFATVGALVVFGVAAAGAQQPPKLATARTTAATKTPVASSSSTRVSTRVLAGTRPNVFTTIQGNALNATNGVLANTPVRLRDARFGRIVDTGITDRSGFFAFRSLDPGSYVVELLGNDQTILAASQILSVDAGSTVTAIVKLPFKMPPFGGLLGHTSASALAILSVAAASGVLAMQVPGTEASPNGTSPQTKVTTSKK
jgi:hypothetical protein